MLLLCLLSKEDYMTKQKSKTQIEVTVTPEFSNMMLYENEKKRTQYLENALKEERKRTAELEQLLKESQLSHEATARSYEKQTENFNKMASHVGAALSTRRNN